MDGGTLVLRPDDPLIGSTIGDRYVVLECVGEGAMGRVYRVRHNRMSRQFAVKVLFGDLAADERMRKRFTREADIASRLKHPNVVSVIDFGETETGLLYLAMDFIEGETLGQRIRRQGPLSEAEARSIATDLAHGLAHAHQHGLVHRDLKPENIIVERHGTKDVAKIVDFGIAFVNDGEQPAGARLTQTGSIIGTPSFMAPEQALGESVGAPADLFSFGICIYFALAGEPPFKGEPVAVLQRLIRDDVPPLKNRRPLVEVSDEFDSIIRRLVQRDAGQRYQTAEAVIKDLEPSGEALPAGATTSAMAALAEQARPARWPWIFGAIALGASAGIWVVFAQAPVPAPISIELPRRPPTNSDVTAPAASEAPPPLRLAKEPTAPAPPPPKEPPKKRRRASRAKKRVVKKATKDKTPAIEASAQKDMPAPGAPADLKAQYLAVGKALDALATARGEDAAASLRKRYFKIPFSDALRIETVRRDAIKTLAALRRDIDRARDD